MLRPSAYLLVLAAACAVLSTPSTAQLFQNLLGSSRPASGNGLFDGIGNLGSSSAALFASPEAAAAVTANSKFCRMERGSEHGFCGLPYELSNFQGHYKCDRSVLIGRPADREQLANLVKFYPKVKAVGVGHSWWKEQFCSGSNSSAINIVTTEFTSTLPAAQGFPEVAIIVDESAMTATVAGGVTQRTLLKYLDNYKTDASPDGYTLPAFSWFVDQTMAGAVATATHGSSLVYGSLSSQLRALTIMDADGNVRTFAPSSDPHLWKAATVSVGRMGIILDLTIAIIKNLPVKRDKTDIQVEAFVSAVGELQSSFNAAAAGGNSMFSLNVWQALKPWNERQLFWFIPSRLLWNVSFTRVDPLEDPEVMQILAQDGPADEAMPEGAYTQLETKAVGTGVGMESNAAFWSDQYRLYLSINVVPGVLPARESYVSISEMENRLYSTWNSYDQYEVAVPLSKAGDCLKAVQDELYGPREAWRGFRSPALVRFVRAEQSYLSPANGEPVMYVNLEDHVTYATGKTNEDFQAVLRVFRSPVCGSARLHWGKAGWTKHAQCFDGAKEYPNTWCDFGCATHQVDPYGKFSAEAGTGVWQWNAVEAATGAPVANFTTCCSSTGFDTTRCKCVARTDCGSSQPEADSSVAQFGR